MIRYGSVCSGVEAATVAWHTLGWQPQWFSEIEAFPSAVLAHHYPDVPNLGDMTKLNESDVFHGRPINLLVGGTPCQSFSIAGLRKGLEDPRGNLCLTYLALAAAKRPQWIVWENVPGVLSSNGGRDFGAFLGALGHLGYGFAYRVLDAQYFGVAQRRRRVFVVGYLGDWRPAAKVLFEPESLRGHSAPRREEGQKIAPTLSARTKAGGGLGTDFDCDGGLVYSEAKLTGFTLSGFGEYREGCGTLRAKGGDIGGGTETLIPSIMPTMRSGAPNGNKSHGARSGDSKDEYIVTHVQGVRRITPRECERLQGFPDDYTLIPMPMKKRQTRQRYAADNPRYKAIGNSMAVPCMRWIGERIQSAETANDNISEAMRGAA